MYTYEDFLDIVKALRSENGCPWDKAQTPMSLRSCLVEETYEVLQAVKKREQSGEYENLREELGDLLFLVVLYAQIASEEGTFTMDDVVHGIAEKMVYRHPHVFEDPEKYDPNDAVDNWDRLKKREKELRSKKEHTEGGRPESGSLEGGSGEESQEQIKQLQYQKRDDYHQRIQNLERIARNLKQLDACEDRETIALLEGDLLLEITQISQVCDLPLKKILAKRIIDDVK